MNGVSANGWVFESIEIQGPKGPSIVPGYTHPLCPGLAVTMAAFGWFNVTHMLSGRKVFGGYERCAFAELKMAQAAACYDWTQSMEDMVRQIDASKETPVPFEGATTTDKDGTRPTTRYTWFMCARNWVLGDEFPWEEEHPGTSADIVLAGIAARASSSVPA